MPVAKSAWIRARSMAPDVALVSVVALALAVSFVVLLFGP